MGEAVLLESNLYHRHLSRHDYPLHGAGTPLPTFSRGGSGVPARRLGRETASRSVCTPPRSRTASPAHTHTQHSTKVRKRKPSNARPGTLLPEITWALAVESTAEMRTAVTNHRRRPPKYQPLSCMSDTPSKCTQLAKRPFLFFHLKLNPSSFLRGVEQSNKGASQTRPL